MGKERNPHQPVGANTPNWVIWLIVAAFLAIVVGGVQLNEAVKPDTSPSPTSSVR